MKNKTYAVSKEKWKDEIEFSGEQYFEPLNANDVASFEKRNERQNAGLLQYGDFSDLKRVFYF